MARPARPSPADVRERLELLRARNDLRLEGVRRRAIIARESAVRAVSGGFRGTFGSFTSARRDRTRSGPLPSGGSADYHLDGVSREALVRECRHLRRVNSIARAFVKRKRALLIGDGAIVASTSRSPAWNEAFDSCWERFCEGRDADVLGHPDLRRRRTVWQIIAGTVQAWDTDGDSLMIFTDEGIQTVEAELVRHNPSLGIGAGPVVTQRGTVVCDGVETAKGVPVAYHVARWSVDGRAPAGPVTPVRADNAILCANPVDCEANQTRGEPGMQSVIQRIEHIDRYVRSIGHAAEMATYLGLIFKSERPGDQQYLMEAATSDQGEDDDDKPREIQLGPGWTFTCRPGESVEQVKPEFPTTNTQQYIASTMALIAADLGCPLVMSHFDAAALSWSNIKALGAIAFRGLQEQQHELVRIVRKIREWKARQWMEQGVIDAVDDWDACDIAMQGAPVLDFAAESKGWADAIDNNLTTKDRATQALGSGRAMDVFRVRKIEREAELAAGIAPPDKPGAVRPGAPNAPPSADASADPNADPAADPNGAP